MEFYLEQIRRDWFEGISGKALGDLIELRCRELSSHQGIAVIREIRPLAFAAEFFAALFLGKSIALANPNWGSLESAQFDSLLSIPLDSPSILIPTGGTTGGVKLAIHDWSSLCAASKGVQAFLGGEAIHSNCCLPLYHVSGLMQLIRSLISGGTICFDNLDYEGRCFSLVPTQLQRLLEDKESTRNLGAARAIFVGGAPMSDALADKARWLKLPVIPVYGMTETAAMCAAIPNEDFIYSPGAGAVPLGDAQFSSEADGRIRIFSSALFKGYHGQDSIDHSQGYLSGDIGSIDDDGRLHVEGRADRIIISGGEKIDPAEVERVLCQQAGVNEALALGQPDEEWGERLLVFYTGENPLSESDLLAQLTKQLSKHKVPKRCLAVDALPLDVRGKVDRDLVARLLTEA